MSDIGPCAECGLAPAVMFKGRDPLCGRCGTVPPKEITMYARSDGQVWWNDSAGGTAQKYVRADLLDAARARPRRAPSEDEVEVCARSLFEARNAARRRRHIPVLEWEQLDVEDRDVWRAVARAAIEYTFTGKTGATA